jgi:hypothetical protein
VHARGGKKNQVFRFQACAAVCVQQPRRMIRRLRGGGERGGPARSSHTFSPKPFSPKPFSPKPFSPKPFSRLGLLTHFPPNPLSSSQNPLCLLKQPPFPQGVNPAYPSIQSLLPPPSGHTDLRSLDTPDAHKTFSIVRPGSMKVLLTGHNARGKKKCDLGRTVLLVSKVGGTREAGDPIEARRHFPARGCIVERPKQAPEDRQGCQTRPAPCATEEIIAGTITYVHRLQVQNRCLEPFLLKSSSESTPSLTQACAH